MKLLCTLIGGLLFFKTHAQVVITGKITDQKNITLSNINITIKKRNEHTIAAFAITDEKGQFEIVSSIAVDSIVIKITAVGYATQEFTIANKSKELNFILTEKVTELPTVIVQQKPMTIQGDTTNYNVSNFSGKQDRVIGDVIAKLPGIEIDANGQIKYNGQAISNYYIDGMDMLGNKYNIANQNIPSNLVDQVQILNNHQPIRLLDSLNTSNTPALNIKLNKTAKNKLINRAKAGIGGSPFLWDNALTTLRFKPTNQLLTAYKNNNTGIALGNELANNVSITKVGEAAEQNKKENILNITTFAKPNIADNKYLFNNTHLAHANILKALKNTGQLKFNTSYLNDRIDNNIDVNTTYKVANDTINIKENQSFLTTKQQINNSLEYNMNTKKKFLKNITKANILLQKEYSTVKDTAAITQKLYNPFYDYTNDFVLQIPIRKKIYSFNSVINYNITPQVLEVTPGQFTSILNQSLPYQKVIQQSNFTNFNTHNYVSFLTKINKWQQQIKIGNEYIHKSINSFIEKEVNQNKYVLNDTFKNNLIWQNNRLYSETKTVFQKKEHQLEIELPFEINSLKLNNKIVNKHYQQSKLFFNPKATLHIVANPYISFDFLYSRLNSFGSPLQATVGYILTNYRSITKNDTLVPLNKQTIYYFSSFYKNPLKGIFGYATIAYTETKLNLTFRQQFDNFLIQSIAMPISNTQKSVLANFNVSKYFLAAKTNITLNFNNSFINFNQFIQNDLATIANTSTRVQFKVNIAKIRWMSIESITNYTKAKSKIATNDITRQVAPNYRLEQILKMYFYISSKLVVFSSNEFYKLRNTTIKGNYLFCDIGVNYKFKKASLEVLCTNLLNTKEYINFYLSNNYEQTLVQQMRPTNFLIKYYFNF
jgi:CarboxypepD_reg-like domain